MGLAMATQPKIDKAMKAHALRLLQREQGGGNIKGSKLFPLAQALMPMVEIPSEPVALNRRSYIVQVAAQQEGNVVEALRKAGLDAYCPFEPTKVRVNNHKHRIVRRAMMPGYVFPIFDEHRDDWEIIHPEDRGNGIKGVIRLFKFDMRPIPLLDEVIQYIRDKELERQGGRCAKRAPITLKVGVLVKILEPLSFAGLFGFIVEVSQERYQVRVEVDIFGRKVPIWLDPEQVEAV